MILIGMMGSGKSTVGRVLAESTGRVHLDTDKELEHRLGSSINKLFSVYGEDAFRDHETALLHSLEPSAMVLSTGGGIILREQNWEEIRRLGISIYLEASIEVLFQRLERGKWRRPLLKTEDWQQRVSDILASRQELYRRADIVVNIDHRTTEEIVGMIQQRLAE